MKQLKDMTNDEFAKACKELEKALLGWSDMTFMIRELGFDDHTRIHHAAKQIASVYVARIILKFGMHRED